MPLTVSVSQLRNNLSDYLDKVSNGTSVLVRDEKRNVTIAEINKTTSFNKDTYAQVLKKSAGILSEKDHPEWKTQQKVTDWLVNSRQADERSF